MSTTKRGAPRFRIGDWVSFLYGPKKVLAQIIEDRGRLGVKRRRLYRVRLDRDDDEPTTFEIPEENLEKAPEAEKAPRGAKGVGAIQRTASYFGKEEDQFGMPQPWYYYLVVASPGPKPGSGLASIISLSTAAHDLGTKPGPFQALVAREGGPEAALAKAEEFLDSQHPGLKKIISEEKS